MEIYMNFGTSGLQNCFVSFHPVESYNQIEDLFLHLRSHMQIENSSIFK